MSQIQFVSEPIKAALYAGSAALLSAAKSGTSQTDALKAFVEGLNERGVYLAEISKSGTLKPDNKLSVQAGAAQRTWDPEGPYFADVSAKSKPHGCGGQVERAKQGMNLTQLAALEAAVPVPDSFVGVPPSLCGIHCECRIAENGCIDPSLCTVQHPLAALPAITRWTFATAGIITGGCNQLSWSGWAHPAVMSLLDRFPTCGEVKRLLQRTHKKLQHLNEFVRVTLERQYPDGTRLYHFHYVDKHVRASTTDKVKISDALKSIRDNDRIGGVSSEEVPTTGKSMPLPTTFRPTPAVEALGGLSIVPTFLCALQKAPGFDQLWTPTSFPTDATDVSTDWRVEAGNEDIRVYRRSEFVYHYPEELNNPQLPHRFADHLTSRWAYRQRGGLNLRLLTRGVNYSRSFRAQPPVRVAIPDFSPIVEYLNGSLDYETLKTADNVAAFSRALGSRANRLQQGWESEIAARWMRVRDHARSGGQTRQYFEFAYRLITRYIGAMAARDMNASVPECTVQVANSATNVQLVYINAATPLPAPGAPGAPPAPVNNGEHPYWDYAAQTALANGTAQFLDVEGLAREEIAQALAAIVPTTNDNVPTIRCTHADPGDGVDRSWLLHVLRNTYQNGVDTVFLHFGNNPLPNQGTQNWLQAHANNPPDASIISSLIRHFGSRHDIANFFEDAIHTALYRTVGYKSDDALGTDPAMVDNHVLDADGNDRLYLPRNNTRWGYFDVFYQPVALTPLIETFLAYSSREIVNIGSLLSHGKANAINWASKALTLLGNEWNIPAAGGNQYLRNHWDKLVRHYYNSTVTLWSTIHANALAFSFGFTQPAISRATEFGRVWDWWSAYQAPYMANHYMELWAIKAMPMFQALPYYDPDAQTSHVQWPSDTPRPAQNWLAFDQTRQVKVAREFDPIPGYAWLGDGGPEYNLQFYVAQGNNGQWAKDGGVHKEQLLWWPGERIDQPPVAPNPVPLAQRRYMGGPNTPWADFLLPGSVRSYDTDTFRIRNWAVQQANATPLTTTESHRWWEAANELPHRSLMVNYIHPFRERREIDAIADYSVVFWEQDNVFAGLTFSNLFSEIAKGDARFDTLRPQQTMFDLYAHAGPRISEFYNPTRVSSRAKPSVKGGSSKERIVAPLKFQSISKDVVERIAAMNQPAPPEGTIRYDTKYPHLASELPPTSEHVVEYDHEAISALPDERPSPETLAKLARLENHAAEYEAAFESFLAEQRARVMAKDPACRQKTSYWIPPNPRGQKSQTHKRAVMTGGVGTGQRLAFDYQPSDQRVRTDSSRSANTPRQKTVTFNDSAASASQGEALRLKEIIENSNRGFKPAISVAGVRYPHRRSNSASQEPSDALRQPTVEEVEDDEDEPFHDAKDDATPAHSIIPPPEKPFRPEHATNDGSLSDGAAQHIANIMGDLQPPVRDMQLTVPKN
jgi:hypothetical protein